MSDAAELCGMESADSSAVVRLEIDCVHGTSVAGSFLYFIMTLLRLCLFAAHVSTADNI